MTDIAPINPPKPPDGTNINDLHKWSKDMYGWIMENFARGNAITSFSQAQIDSMSGLDFATKLFFNTTTGKFMGGEVDGGNTLAIRTFTAT